MKKRRHKLTAQKKRAAQRDAVVAEEIKIGAYGPADPMPDGRIRRASMDAISRLKHTGQLSQEMESAALEIAEVFRARVAGLMPSAQKFERVDRSDGESPQAWLLDAGRRYDKWADWSKRRKADTGVNVHEIIMDVMIDGWTLRECDRKLRKDHGTAKAEIQKGLVAYALLAGWVRLAA